MVDAKDFVGNGSLSIYDNSGKLTNSFGTNTAPRRILLAYNDNTVSVEEDGFEPIFRLEQNYPNPFNPSTVIQYQIPLTVDALSPVEVQNVSLIIYDILGKKIKTLVDTQQSPGNYSVQFDASYLASGIYYYKLQVGELISTRKMILLK